MSDSPITRPSLLVRIRDSQDKDAWQQFVELYAPLVYRFARKRGLQDADAADLTQVVMHAIAGSIARLDYDPERGAFRGWLFSVVRHQLSKFLARQKRSTQGTGDTSMHERLEQQPAKELNEEIIWEQEYERHLFLAAVDRVRGSFEESSWQAFWQTAVDGKSARQAAEVLGTTVGAVYTAKSRVLDRVKKEIQQMQLEETAVRSNSR